MNIRLFSYLYTKLRHLRKANDLKKNVDFYSQFINKGDLCFDVGANIGSRTEVFLKLGAKVICIEPQDSCIKILNRLFKNEINVLIIHMSSVKE